jgi:hypothetical protein
MAELGAVSILVAKLRERLLNGEVASYEEYHAIFMDFLGKPASMEVKAHGEVYTPLSLVTEMLDKLPAHVWSNPALKWFEPACGLAPFLYMAYHRLLSGLEAVIPDEAERIRHILEKMFYFNEVQPKNIELFKLLFNAGSYRLNIFEGSFFEAVPSNFQTDIVVGNPPYNAPGTGRNIIWNKFVNEIFERQYLAPNGFLVFIHPALWRKPVTVKSPVYGIYDLLIRQHQLLYLDINDLAAGKKTFACGTRYDWYVLENKEPYTTTTVKCEKGTVHSLHLQEWPWLPNTEFELIGKLLGEPSESVIRSRSDYGTDKEWVSSEQNNTYRYPLIHSTTKINPILSYSSRIAKSDTMYGVRKVIVGTSGIGYPVVDLNGEYGMTDNCFGFHVIDQSDADILIGFLKSDDFRRLQIGCSWSVYRLDYHLFDFFKAGFWRDFKASNLKHALEIGTENQCQAMTTKGSQCSRKSLDDGFCKQHQKTTVSRLPSSQAKPIDTSSSSSSSAELDVVKLQDTSRRGYTNEQLKRYCRERHLKFKSNATNPILRELLLQSL